MAYSEPPLRNIVRLIVTSEYSIGRAPSELSIVSVTSARPSGGRPAVPAKMTSSILPPRSALAPCSPSTQATASTTFDLPEPFGPTTQVMPGSKRSVVAEAKDLKPFSVRLLRCTVLRGRTAAGPARGRPSYRPYPVRAGANGTRAARRPAQVVRAAAVLRTGPAGADIAGTGPRRADATPGRARAARPIAAAPAPGRWSGARYAVARPRLPGRVLAPEGMSPRRGGGDPEQHRHSREGPSPSRGPPHQTLRCVLGRARGARIGIRCVRLLQGRTD